MAMTQMEQFIRDYAASIGLNPDVVMQTVLNEGGRQSLEPSGYARQSLVGGTGAGQEPSYGPFQMHMKHLGGRALAAGYDPRDPAQAYNVAKFAMDEIKRAGLGQWHGWKGDPWAAASGNGTGANVPVPNAGNPGSYDPRMDTPSTGKPVGSKLPGVPAGYGGQDAPGTYDLPKTATAPGPKKKGFWDKFGSGLGDSAGPAVQSAMPYGQSQMPPAAVASAEPVSMVNPEQIKMQREMLAQALAALQGSGYGQQQG
jgi:hypothetical protein